MERSIYFIFSTWLHYYYFYIFTNTSRSASRDIEEGHLGITVKSRALNTWHQHVIRSHDGEICSGVRQHLRMRRCPSRRYSTLLLISNASHSYKNTQRLPKIQMADDKTEKNENPQSLVI